jgi:chemotaxis protein methyltransferase CheR
LSGIIKQKFGIILGPHKKDMVYRRLSKRIVELNLKAFSEYYKYLLENNDEQLSLANAITTNLTSFFREPHHFEHLEKVLKAHFEHNKNLTMWSAGSSMGCEAYSIAMTIMKVLGGNVAGHNIKILATDIDTNMLDTGSKGIYEKDLMEKIPSDLHQYLTIREDDFEIASQVKSLVHFKRLNLLEPWPISKKFDNIFCRNTVIYFDKETQKDLFNRFADLIAHKGFMYIGHSENMGSMCPRFVPCGKTIYQRSEDK